MYIRDIFKQQDKNALAACIKQNPLAMLVINGDPYPSVYHVPLLLVHNDDQWRLKGHIAIANPLADVEKSSLVVVFNGADAYVSPGYYATKKVDPRVVPTWNYATVQVQGTLKIRHDAAWKLDLLRQLTQTHEADLTQPWKITDAPADYIEKMLKGIVGIDIKINDIQGKWKVSQNQPVENKQSVADHLGATASEKNKAMAALVKERI